MAVDFLQKTAGAAAPGGPFQKGPPDGPMARPRASRDRATISIVALLTRGLLPAFVIFPILVDTASLSGAIMLIIGAVTVSSASAPPLLPAAKPRAGKSSSGAAWETILAPIILIAARLRREQRPTVKATDRDDHVARGASRAAVVPPPRGELYSALADAGIFRRASNAESSFVSRLLQLGVDRVEGTAETRADRCHDSDGGHCDQRRDQTVFDCRYP